MSKNDNIYVQSLLDASDEIIVLLNTNQIIQNFNKAANEYAKINYQKSLKTGDNILDYIPEEEQNPFIAAFNKALNGEHVTNERIVKFQAHNRRVNLNVKHFPLYDQAGSIIGVSFRTFDITQQKEAEIALAASEQKYKAVIDNIKDVVIQTDEEGKINFLNPAWENITGNSIEESVGKSLSSFIDNEFRQQFYEDIEKLYKGKTRYYHQTVKLLSTKSGNRWGEIYLKPIFNDKEEKIVGISGTLSDVTDSKKAASALENQNRLLEQILDELPINIFIKDHDGNLVFINENTAKSFGLQKDQIIGQSTYKIFPKETADQLAGEDENVKSGKYFSRNEQVIKYGDNDTRYLIAGKKLIKLYEDQPEYVFGYSLDITDRKLAEEKIRKSQADLVEAQKLANLGNWTYDFENDKMTWSEQLFHQYGLDPNQPAPNFDDFYKITHPDDIDHVKNSINLAVREGSARFEQRILLPDGSIRYTQSVVKPIINDQGIPKGLYGISQDITDRKKAEEEIRKAKLKAEQASHAKEQFLSTMSHEIRTPLNAVIGMAHLLLEENLNDDQYESLETLKFSAEHLQALINDILDFNKIEAGKITFEETEFDIKDLVNSIKKTHILKANEKNIKLKVRLDDDLPNVLIGDSTRLSQILNNLVSNAIKFTDKGMVCLDVMVNQEQESSWDIDFAISDTGIGISSDQQENIFESFTQAGKDTTRKFGGTGLGLSITKKLLELQNSQIKVSSKEGKGSKFNFTLNLGKSEKQEITRESKLFVDGSEELKGLYVLLVEDNPLNQLVAKRFLRKWGIELDQANNGVEAFYKVKSIPEGDKFYDLVLMDLQMPEMNGYEATEAIRNLEGERFQQLPIMALTASALSDVKDKVMDSQMNDFITKPFQPKELFEKIAAQTGKHKAKAPVPEPEAQQENKKPQQTILDLSKLEELVGDDEVFANELKNRLESFFRDFEVNYKNALLNRDKEKFKLTVHKLKPTLELINVENLDQEINKGRELMESEHIATQVELEKNVEKITRICHKVLKEIK